MGSAQRECPAAARVAKGSGARAVPVVLLAGDRAHSRAVRHQSKAFVKIAGRTMLEHVFRTVVATPEVGDVFVVGDPARVEQVLAAAGLIRHASARGHGVHIVPQRATLFENVWHGFLATLPPGEPDPDREVLVVPADIPLAVPEELSEFIGLAHVADVDYALGLTPDVALEPFAPREGTPGIEMAYFNLAEGRFRQNNLHLVRPLRMGNREYIQNMYESRYQKELSSMVRLIGQVLRREYRHLWVVMPYLLLHVAGVLDRRGHTRAAAFVRRFVSLRTIERCIGLLLRTRFRTVVTGYGGAALDVDNEHDLDAADKMFDRWRSLQTGREQIAMLTAS